MPEEAGAAESIGGPELARGRETLPARCIGVLGLHWDLLASQLVNALDFYN